MGNIIGSQEFIVYVDMTIENESEEWNVKVKDIEDFFSRVPERFTMGLKRVVLKGPLDEIIERLETAFGDPMNAKYHWGKNEIVIYDLPQNKYPLKSLAHELAHHINWITGVRPTRNVEWVISEEMRVWDIVDTVARMNWDAMDGYLHRWMFYCLE